MQRTADAQARAAQLQAEQTTTTDNGGSSSSGQVTDPNAGSPGNVPAPSGSAQVAVDTARAQLGKPYVYAGSGPDVFDCSGLTMYAWAAAGVSLPHNAEAQYQSLPHVSQSELQPGDLVFFGAPIHHDGIYVGGGTMIEAPYTGVDVRYHTIYRSDYAGGARP
jgi:cell wall-associated NlpC family hydrolase